jgi:hypothetical protein
MWEQGAIQANKGAYIVVCDRRERVLQHSYRKKDRVRDCLRLYGQVSKRIRWMPRRQKAMKDVITCEKLRGAGK